MRARLVVNKEYEERIKEKVKEHYDRAGEGHSRRTFKLLFVILHQYYGFGTNRLKNVMEKVSELSHERKHDEVFWAHIDRLLIDRLN